MEEARQGTDKPSRRAVATQKRKVQNASYSCCIVNQSSSLRSNSNNYPIDTHCYRGNLLAYNAQRRMEYAMSIY
jgi:hypothetical protein